MNKASLNCMKFNNFGRNENIKWEFIFIVIRHYKINKGISIKQVERKYFIYTSAGCQKNSSIIHTDQIIEKKKNIIQFRKKPKE